MEDSLRNIQFHSFQRAFILENVDGQPTMKFKKNLRHADWRGVKGGNEGIQILTHVHQANEHPTAILSIPLADELTEDLLSLTAMPRNIQNFWESWLENPFTTIDHETPQDWEVDFWLDE